MLLQLTFLVLMLFGMAALTIDMGYVRLTQLQMQNAADSAALAGLQQDPDQNRHDPREFAADIAAAAASNGLGPGIQSPDPSCSGCGQLGVVGETQYYNAQNSGPYLQPRLQTNAAANLPYGDMVSGSYDPTKAHTEAPDYSRADFNADPAGTAMLVRLRRTDHRHDGYDRPTTPGISSTGDAVPLMFGRVSMIQDNADPSVNSPRRDGINVRATAIAEWRLQPVLQVGLPVAVPSLPSMPGVTPFALRLDRWTSLGPAGSPAVIFPVADMVFTAQPATSVGITFTQAPAYAISNPVPLGYAPLYADDSHLTVIGFGAVSYSSDATGSVFTVAHVDQPTTSVNTTSVPPPNMPTGLPIVSTGLRPVLVR